MSQHHFYTKHQGEECLVTMGWDRPLQGFFLILEKSSCDEDILWSNLEHDPSHPPFLDIFLKVLDDFKITIPEEMITELKQDKIDNIGNKVVTQLKNPFLLQ